MTHTDPRFDRIAFNASTRRGGGMLGGAMAVLGLVATGVAVTIGAVLAVFTAAAVAVIAVIAAVVVYLTGFGARARRAMRPAAAGGPDEVIEARKVDGTWVAYGWERSNR